VASSCISIGAMAHLYPIMGDSFKCLPS
jgi:hypothetical protein